MELHIATENGNIDCSQIPNFGEHRPDDYELSDEYFVDNSGFGRAGESALTVGQFQTLIKKDCGYAIIDVGQFQIWIGEFVKK